MNNKSFRNTTVLGSFYMTFHRWSANGIVWGLIIFKKYNKIRALKQYLGVHIHRVYFLMLSATQNSVK